MICQLFLRKKIKIFKKTRYADFRKETRMAQITLQTQIKKCRSLRSDICRICTRKVTTPIKFVKHSMTNYQRKSITLPEEYACRTIKVFTRKFYKCGISIIYLIIKYVNLSSAICFTEDPHL